MYFSHRLETIGRAHPIHSELRIAGAVARNYKTLILFLQNKCKTNLPSLKNRLVMV